MEKLGLRSLLDDSFNDSAARVHSNTSIIEQLIYTTIAGYSSDDYSDNLRHDPVFTNILGKKALASQPTILRFVHSSNECSIESYNRLLRNLFEKGNNPKDTKQVVGRNHLELFADWKELLENLIKEAKIDISMESTSHTSFITNAVKTMIKALAYSVINIMKRLLLKDEHKKCRMLFLRPLFIKVACRVVTSARKTTFKLCSSYPLQKYFHRIMSNIEGLSF